MSFRITSTHRQPGTSGITAKAYWRKHQFTYLPEKALLFDTKVEAQDFAFNRLENGWARMYNLDTDVKVEEVAQ